MNDEEIRIKLLGLIQSVKKIIDAEKTNGTIQPEFEPFTQWKVTDFNYDDNGINVGKSGIHITKPTWRYAFVKIFGIIEKTEEYNHLIEELKSKQEINERGSILENFVQRIISIFLENENISDSDINNRIDNFFSELKNKPLKSGATVKLVGIILHPYEIEISHGIILRIPKKEDFEIDLPVYGLYIPEHFSDPTAFLEISMQAKTPREVQEEITKIITILRLFRSGSVKYMTYRMHSDAISRFFGGTTGSGDTFPALEKYHINDEDINNLKTFFERMSQVLPPIFYRFEIGREDHISIAYNRYSDALLQSGIIERRIANAIMGLEALYFKPSGEQQELIFRLGIRVAKILGNFSFDPIQVRSALKDAYTIRSIFSHGGHLEYKQKRRFNEKYNGDINNLLKNILDFLRVSIIISITIRLEKDEFIDTIDNAFIEQNANQRLINILNPAKHIIENK